MKQSVRAGFLVGFLIGNVITGMREGSQWKEAVENGLVTVSYYYQSYKVGKAHTVS